MILEMLFDGGFTRSKTRLEAHTRVKERFVIMSKRSVVISLRFICSQDPENLSKKEEGSDCQRSWNLALEKGTSRHR